MKGNKHIKSFNEHQESLSISDAGEGFGLKTGEYVLYGHNSVNKPLTIKITKIEDGWVEYSFGNESEKDWFKFSEIEKVKGEEIYLTKRNDEYYKAIKDVSPLIPEITKDIIRENGLEDTKEKIIELNSEIQQKVEQGDADILDRMWDKAGSLVLKHAINVITHYHKNN